MTLRYVLFWKDSINEEINSLLFNNTWVLVNLPSGFMPIENEWAFKKKYNADGSI